MYNPKYKILFKFDPSAQAILGQWNGWRLVLEAVTDSRKYREGDEVKFTYTQAKWDKLVEYIKEASRCL